MLAHTQQQQMLANTAAKNHTLDQKLGERLFAVDGMVLKQEPDTDHQHAVLSLIILFLLVLLCLQAGRQINQRRNLTVEVRKQLPRFVSVYVARYSTNVHRPQAYC